MPPAKQAFVLSSAFWQAEAVPKCGQGGMNLKSWVLCRAAVAVLVAAPAVSLFAGPASAEPPIGSRLGQRLDKNEVGNERDSAQSAHQLAGCILAKKGSTGRDILNARSAEEVKKLQTKMNGEVDCFAILPGNDFVEGVVVSYPPQIMRGDLAEELLKRSRPAVARLPLLPIQKGYERSWFPFTGRPQSVDEMATCVAESNPLAIMALIDSEPFSDRENIAFGNLVPAMGPCLVAGAKLEGKREPLRAALAEALYQRATNPGESVAQPATAASQK